MASILDQIIKDLYIDPELLSELTEEQKQILFCKMREEQVRRWNEMEKDTDAKPAKQPKPNKKGHRVDFLHGKDGAPWVWVMGEHPDDLTIEQMLEKEALESAQTVADQEAKALREVVETTGEASVEEVIAEKPAVPKPEPCTSKEKENQPKKPVIPQKPVPPVRRKKRVSSIRDVEEYQKERSSQIYENFRNVRKNVAKEAEADSKDLDQHWREQEEKAKRIESIRRDTARKARNEYRESIQNLTKVKAVSKAFLALQQLSESVKQAKDKPRTAPTKDEIVTWFKDSERPKGSGIDPKTDQVASWFHGMISRKQAEELLEEKSVSSFLVRLSEKIYGYAVSYRTEDGFKHFLINTSNNQYQFFGTNQQIFDSLAKLISSHKKSPISAAGKEFLLYPCGQAKNSCDYKELFQDCETENTRL